MNLLLDTHAFIWFVGGDMLLSHEAKKAIENKANLSFVSIASLWEMAIKTNLGKLSVMEPFADVMGEIELKEFTILQIEFPHAELVSRLENHHRDPFDRMLIAQSFSRGFAIVSNETVFDKYGVKRIC